MQKTHCHIFVTLTVCMILSCANGTSANNIHTNATARGFDARSMLTNLATNIMSRGYVGGGGSQVVSLNLTNLLVLVLLKALIFAAGTIGAGAWKGGLARSSDGQETIMTDEEVLFFISYLTGEPGNNGCLQSLACLQPQQAKKYAAAGDALLKTAKMLSYDVEEKYDYTLKELREAASYGSMNGNCSRYKCGANIIE